MYLWSMSVSAEIAFPFIFCFSFSFPHLYIDVRILFRTLQGGSGSGLRVVYPPSFTVPIFTTFSLPPSIHHSNSPSPTIFYVSPSPCGLAVALLSRTGQWRYDVGGCTVLGFPFLCLCVVFVRVVAFGVGGGGKVLRVAECCERRGKSDSKEQRREAVLPRVVEESFVVFRRYPGAC